MIAWLPWQPRRLKNHRYVINNDIMCRQLTHYQRQISDSSQLKYFAEDNFKVKENGRKLSKPIEDTVGKGEICSLRAISPFPSVFKRLVSQGIKRCHCVGMA